MQADSAELACLSVEEESLVRDNLYCPESECSPFAVLDLMAVGDAYLRPVHIPGCIDRTSEMNLCTGIIEIRAFRRPEHRIIDSYVLLHFSVEKKSGVGFCCDHLHIGSVDDPGSDSDHTSVLYTFYLRPDIDRRIILPDMRCGHVCSPYRYMYLWKGDMANLSVKSGSRIPS